MAKAKKIENRISRSRPQATAARAPPQEFGALLHQGSLFVEVDTCCRVARRTFRDDAVDVVECVWSVALIDELQTHYRTIIYRGIRGAARPRSGCNHTCAPRPDPVDLLGHDHKGRVEVVLVERRSPGWVQGVDDGGRDGAERRLNSLRAAGKRCGVRGYKTPKSSKAERIAAGCENRQTTSGPGDTRGGIRLMAKPCLLCLVSKRGCNDLVRSNLNLSGYDLSCRTGGRGW